MYASHFSMTEKPFAITPDPRYLFLSERHADALAHLLYGINEAGGFIQLTGEIGTGKTTLVRALLERLPGHTDVAVLLNPRISPLELLQSVCQELNVAIAEAERGSPRALVDALNARLLTAHATGRRVVVLLDEAQNLSSETLEQLRLLTNLETASRKLLQIILVGQPELRDVLARPELRQLAQRVTGRFHLTPLARADTAAYIKHRLKVAGVNGEVFTAAALKEIHRLSGGVPRVINVICDRALLGAYTQDRHRVDAALARSAASEAYGRHYRPRGLAWAIAASATLVAGLLSFSIAQLLHQDSPAQPVTQSAPAPSTPPAAPPALDIQTLFANHPDLGDGNAAFGHLLQLWGAHYAAEQGHPCEQALQQGLQCAHQRGSWGQVRLLNRPAILSLDAANGASQQVVIASLNDDSAEVLAGSGSERVSLSSLSLAWQGEYLILWRPPWLAVVNGAQAQPAPLAQRDLSVGMRGDPVRWLRRGLDALAGAPSDGGSDYFDAQLAARIQEFQRQHRLSVDGIAGMQTQIVLDSLVDSSATPRLLAKHAGEG